MRNMRRNQRGIWYSNKTGTTQARDEYGNRYGDDVITWSEPETLKISVSGSVGELEAAAFGGFTDYSRTAATVNLDCPLKEGTRVWIERTPPMETHNYVVTKRAENLNGVLYALKEVVP